MISPDSVPVLVRCALELYKAIPNTFRVKRRHFYHCLASLYYHSADYKMCLRNHLDAAILASTWFSDEAIFKVYFTNTIVCNQIIASCKNLNDVNTQIMMFQICPLAFPAGYPHVFKLIETAFNNKKLYKIVECLWDLILIEYAGSMLFKSTDESDQALGKVLVSDYCL